MLCLRRLLKAQSFIVAFLFFSGALSAQTRNITPFAQADTSSPQATLQTFLGSLEDNLLPTIKKPFCPTLHLTGFIPTQKNSAFMLKTSSPSFVV